jgi:hypothetical protein
MKRHLAEEKFSCEIPAMLSYPGCCDICRVTLTVFEFLTANQFDGYRNAPQRRKYFHSKTRPRLPISGLLTCFAWILSFSSDSRQFNSAATKAPPSGENIFLRKPDPDFLLVFCWHFVCISWLVQLVLARSHLQRSYWIHIFWNRFT